MCVTHKVSPCLCLPPTGSLFPLPPQDRAHALHHLLHVWKPMCSGQVSVHNNTLQRLRCDSDRLILDINFKRKLSVEVPIHPGHSYPRGRWIRSNQVQLLPIRRPRGYSICSCTTLFHSTMFLMGPLKQLKRMCDKTRALATAIMIVSAQTYIAFSFPFLYSSTRSITDLPPRSSSACRLLKENE